MEKTTMSVQELSAQMGISLPKAYELVKTPGFPTIRIGARILIPIEAYKKYAAGNGTKYYRVRKSWTDAASQLGAFTSLENAKSACKAGYTVYDDNGKAVYTAAGQQASAGVPFSVQVDILDLNIRTGAGTNYAKTGETTGKGVFTIVEVKAGQGASVGWGRLKSGAGWISLDYATRLA